MVEVFGVGFELPTFLESLGIMWSTVILNAAAWGLLTAIVGTLVFFIVPRISRITRTDLDNTIIGVLQKPVVIAILATGVRYTILASPVGESQRTIVSNVYWLFIIWIIAFALWRLIVEVVGVYGREIAERTESKLDDILIPLVQRAGSLIVGIAAILLSLGIFGINISTVLAVLGGLSFILIFMLQEPLGNMFSGVYLLTDAPFKIGDFIKLENDRVYQVRNIGLRVTELYDIEEHTVAYVPNNKLATERIVNITRPNVEMLDRISVGIGYESDVDLATVLLKAIAQAHPRVLGLVEAKLAAASVVRPEATDYLKGLFESMGTSPRWSQVPQRFSQQLPDEKQELSKYLGDALSSVWPNPFVTGLELERIVAEYALRQRAEEILNNLERLRAFVHSIEMGGLSSGERKRIEDAINVLLSKQEAWRFTLTVWLHLERLLSWAKEKAFIDSKGQPSPGYWINHVSESIEARTWSVVGDHDDIDLELSGIGLMVETGLEVEVDKGRTCGHIRDVESTEHESSLESHADLPGHAPIVSFANMAHYEEFHDLYQAWHLNVRRFKQKLTRLENLSTLSIGREMQVDREISRLGNWFESTFMLEVPEWKRPSVNFNSLGDSALELELEFFVDDIVREHFGRLDDVRTDLRNAIVRSFKSAGIEIPFPQADVWIRGQSDAS